MMSGAGSLIGPYQKYAFSNARVRAMKSLLLDDSTLYGLIPVTSVTAMVELLQKTTYREEFGASSSLFSGRSLLEYAISMNFAKTVSKLLRLTPATDRQLIAALLARFDLLNLKTIIHAKRLGKPYSQIRSNLFAVGGFSEDDLQRIYRSEEHSLMNEVSRTKFGSFISNSSSGARKDGVNVFRAALKSYVSFMEHESDLDAALYAMIDSSLSSYGLQLAHIRNVLKKEIDVKNVLIVERLKKLGFDQTKVKKTLIRGGLLSDSFLMKLFDSRDQSTTLSLLKPYFGNVETTADGPISLEMALDRYIASEKLQAFSRSVFSAGVIAGFIFLKENEVSNLRKIAISKEFSLPTEKVKEMIVVV